MVTKVNLIISVPSFGNEYTILHKYSCTRNICENCIEVAKSFARDYICSTSNKALDCKFKVTYTEEGKRYSHTLEAWEEDTFYYKVKIDNSLLWLEVPCRHNDEKDMSEFINMWFDAIDRKTYFD